MQTAANEGVVVDDKHAVLVGMHIRRVLGTGRGAMPSQRAKLLMMGLEQCIVSVDSVTQKAIPRPGK